MPIRRIKKMKKKLTIIVALIAALALLIGCAGNDVVDTDDNGDAPAPVETQDDDDDDDEDDDPADDAVTEITLVNNKPETDPHLRAYAEVFYEQTGIVVNIVTYGGETPYAASLTAMFNAGDEPEIFVIEGMTDFVAARDSGRITDLSNEPWVTDTDVAFIYEGTVYGFPVSVEGWGLGYNVALLEQAGVDPSTMTDIDGIRAAFEQVDAMSDELGIDGVVSMAAGAGMTWVTGIHGFNGYLALGVDYDDHSYLERLLEGEVDVDRLTAFAEYYELIFTHSIANTLLTGGYDQQLADFAVGNTVFIHQGNWTDPAFAELGIDFEMGYVPHAFLGETTPGIFAGAPSWYVVNGNSAGAEAAKQFLAAMSGTPEGHHFMVNEAGMVPAFNSVTYSPDGSLSQAVQGFVERGEIYPILATSMPAGFGMNTLGPIFEQLASGSITVEEFVDLVVDAVENIGPNE